MSKKIECSLSFTASIKAQVEKDPNWKPDSPKQKG